MSWISLIVAVLKAINAIMDYVNRERLMQAGYDKAIADETAAILKKTAAGRAMMEKVNAMSDAEVDAGLRNLERLSDCPDRQLLPGLPAHRDAEGRRFDRGELWREAPDSGK